MSVEEYVGELSTYGTIISSKTDHVGYEIIFSYDTIDSEIFKRLYMEYLESEYRLTGDCHELGYYKAYFLKKI